VLWGLSTAFGRYWAQSMGHHLQPYFEVNGVDDAQGCDRWARRCDLTRKKFQSTCAQQQQQQQVLA